MQSLVLCACGEKLWSLADSRRGRCYACEHREPTVDVVDRKGTPLTTGCLDYFRNALEAVARHSKWGNDKHNPGEPLHWAVGKSQDHADCILRHLADRGNIDPETGKSHSIALAWRALALLEEELIAAGATPGRARK